MLEEVWYFYLAYWLEIFWAIIGAAFLSIAATLGIDKIRTWADEDQFTEEEEGEWLEDTSIPSKADHRL